MAIPREQLVSLSDTPWYHLVSKCVRRAWLFGVDPYDGVDHSHRRQWVVDRMNRLTQAFAIDIASYAIMSNHYHLVVRVDAERAQHWSWQEVVARWHQIYKGNMLSQRLMSGETLPTAERKVLQSKAEIWRTRLSDISWFMAALNEHIARLANAEDDISGKFWQARFFSQALLDEQAILACSVYVDLNPIRAKMAETPEASEYTSIQKRIKAVKKGTIPDNLLRFQGPEIKEQEAGLPCSLKDYIKLVEATGRIERADKRGAITAKQSPILKRLKIDPNTWHQIATTFEDSAGSWVGHPNRIKEACERLDKRWICQSDKVIKLYPT
jgi:hypothetical protein